MSLQAPNCGGCWFLLLEVAHSMSQKQSANLQKIYRVMLILYDIIVRQLTEFRIVSFVKEQFSANFLNDDIPAVVGTNTAHQSCQDRVSCINIAFSFSQLQTERICVTDIKIYVKDGHTLRMIGSSVVVTLWKILSILCSLRSFLTVTRSYCLS